MSPFGPTGSVAPGPRVSTRRLVAFSIALLLHVLFAALFYLSGPDPRGGLGSGAGVSGPVVMTLSAISASGARAGGTGADGLPPPGAGAAPVPREIGHGADTRGADGKDDALGDMIAHAIADDPLGGGASASYRELLRRHIAAYRQTPEGARGTANAGIVVVRFNVDRAGFILDARIIRTQGNRLDQAALATLWHAEPLPAIPAELPAPLEVEMPVDFRVYG